MRLYYFRHKDGALNFGDDLNPWLWDRLLPGMFDEDDASLFVGIGSLLNSKMPRAERMIVFSSGVGYGEPPAVAANWTFYCVRGPLSAQALGISPALAVTDGAMLVRRVVQPVAAKRFRRAYMPHLLQEQQNGPAYRAACGALGLHYISPNNDPGCVIDQINASELLITEALHGAIVADALRVPWIPVQSRDDIYAFKWHDWCRSLGLVYSPHRLPALWTPGETSDTLARLRFEVKSRLLRIQLRRLLWTVRPLLSDERTMLGAVLRLEAALERFKTDARRHRLVAV
jgi:succinoglycan biosynthesis protein ExoV